MVSNALVELRNSQSVNMMKTIVKFIKEALQELKKVTWPTRQAALKMTLGVIVISALFAIVIGIVDIGLTKGIEGLLTWIAQRQSSQQSGSNSPIQVNPGDIQVETTPAQ